MEHQELELRRAHQERRNKMADEIKTEQKIEQKAENKVEHKPEQKAVAVSTATQDNKEVKTDVKTDSKSEIKANVKPEVKQEEKKDEKKESKKPKVEKPKKEEAIARGTNLKASKKHCMYISTFIKNKPIDLAIKQLQEVIAYKRVLPFKGEIPHRSAPGIMSGRYPINASKEVIYVLKALKGNVIANGLDLDKTRICFASATWASRPARRGGTRFKRTFLVLKAKEFTEKVKQETKK
jgi:large subunit ribosomal protein L22